METHAALANTRRAAHCANVVGKKATGQMHVWRDNNKQTAEHVQRDNNKQQRSSSGQNPHL